MTYISMYGSETGLPQGNGSAKNLPFAEKAYFQVCNQEDAGVAVLDFSEMIITDVSEQFVEGEARHNVLADTFVTFATGAQPTNISIQGWLFVNSEQDDRYTFLDLYKWYYRGTMSTGAYDDIAYLQLLFVLKDTQFKLNVTSCQVKEEALMPDFTHISLTGVAFEYKSYYVPVVVTEEDSEPEEDSETEQTGIESLGASDGSGYVA